MNIEAIKQLIASTYRPEEYPALAHQMETWKHTRPLNHKKVLDATPVFRNTLTKYLALWSAGAEVTVGISDVMPFDAEVVNLLKASGVPVVHAKAAPVAQDFILDCAASFCNWPASIGYVELTRSGVEYYEEAEKPVFIADSGRIKRIETCLGTGESYYRAMAQLGYTDWQGKKLIVFGSGKVGTGIITYAFQKGAEVTVVTAPDSIGEAARKCAHSIIDFKDRQAVEQAVKAAYAIVTVTGVPGAFAMSCSPEALLQSGAIAANMGVEDEYGPTIPVHRILMQKKTLNFILEEPTHLKYIDATMALHNEGAVYLAAHPSASGSIVPPVEMEEQLLDICRKNGCIGSELDLI